MGNPASKKRSTAVEDGNAAGSSKSRPPSGADSAATPPKGPEKGYEHVIEKGQTLSAIVEAYRSKGIKVTLKQVLEANPNINEKKLSVGQKVFIPLPEK